MDVLGRILKAKRADLEIEKLQMPMRRAIELASAAPPPHDFVAALRRTDRINIIAEVKITSVTRGSVPTPSNPHSLARTYEQAGAAAISVLTDERFLLGSPEHLRTARQAVEVPILRKDFIFDEYQIYQSRALGADSLLLIARVLEPRLLQTLIGVTRSLHMEALVEVHGPDDLDKAIGCGAAIVGVNNRDPETMGISLEKSLAMASRLPPGAVAVSESGIETKEDVACLRDVGFHAFLIGAALKKAADPGAALRALIGADPTAQP